jgi:hypothetical protein
VWCRQFRYGFACRLDGTARRAFGLHDKSASLLVSRPGCHRPAQIARAVHFLTSFSSRWFASTAAWARVFFNGLGGCRGGITSAAPRSLPATRWLVFEFESHSLLTPRPSLIQRTRRVHFQKLPRPRGHQVCRGYSGSGKIKTGKTVCRNQNSKADTRLAF